VARADLTFDGFRSNLDLCGPALERAAESSAELDP
jgi:hypothetical protein